MPPKLIPVFLGEARYAGRSRRTRLGKTRTFAKMTAVAAISGARPAKRV
jgi:phage terminase large subunit